MNNVNNLYWFRNDLRISDNLPLFTCSKYKNSAAIYIYDSIIIQDSSFSSLHLDFINDSLGDLSRKFKKQNSHLNIFHGESVKVLESLFKNYRIKNIYSHHEVRDLNTHLINNAVKSLCSANGVKWNQYQRNGVVQGLKDRDGWAYLWNKQMNVPLIQNPNLSNFKKLDISGDIKKTEELKITRTPYCKEFEGGEKAGKLQLNRFLSETGQTYSKNISSPLTAPTSCSRLSSYITYGNLSMRYIVKETQKRQATLREKKIRNGWLGSLSAFSSRLRWHCHFIQKLEMQPSLENTNMVRSFDKIRTKPNTEFFKCWSEGELGVPMVDACMRFLKKNGWINFRMRAMLVSFASYNLWLDWRLTSKFLSKYFIDYEPGIHYNQFQMQSGVTGINAIRIYNPIKQQADHDPDGLFVKKWIPELKNVPNDYLQYPHLMSDLLQKKTGCIIGKSYPAPVVDLKLSSLIARKKIFSIKSLDITKKQSSIAYEMHGSRRKTRRN